MTYCMLSLDLKDADDDQRTDFYYVLDMNGWVKLAGVDTVWKKEFANIITEPSIKLDIGVDFKNALSSSRINLVTFAVQIGDREAVIGETKKVVGNYVTTFK